MIEPNAPPQWVKWGEWFWVGIFIVGSLLELSSVFIDKRIPTATGMFKKYIPWPFVRACLMGGLFYHFVIQPIVETLNKMGIKIF